MASNLESKSRQARQDAIDNMIATWGTGYGQAQGFLDQGAANIRGNAANQRASVGGALSSAGVSSAAGDRATGMDANTSVQNLERYRAGSNYNAWLDLAEIQSNTKWDGTTFNTQPGPNRTDLVMGGLSLGAQMYGAFG